MNLPYIARDALIALLLTVIVALVVFSQKQTTLLGEKMRMGNAVGDWCQRRKGFSTI